MKKVVAFLTLLALASAISSCGNTTPTSVITTETQTSTWEAQLTGGTGQASELTFTTIFSATNNGPIDVTGFSFINSGACFQNGIDNTKQGGTVVLTTTSTDTVTGSMTFIVDSIPPLNNTLTLTSTGLSGTSNGTTATIGNLTGGIVWGTWQLTGGTGDPTCTGQGNFIMCQGNDTCTIP